jgi:hypothetical protein
MNIHQVNVSYSGEQDRLLIRINSLNGEEFRAWLTRRLTLKLLPHLGKTAQAQIEQQFQPPAAGAPLPAQKEQMLKNFKKEAAVYDGDFQTPYKEKPAALPLGEEPLLVTELSFTPLADAKLQVTLLERLPGKQRDLQLVMDSALTQGLLRLLNQSLKASGWIDAPPKLSLGDGSSVAIRSEQEVAEAAEHNAKPRYLN